MTKLFDLLTKISPIIPLLTILVSYLMYQHNKKLYIYQSKDQIIIENLFKKHYYSFEMKINNKITCQNIEQYINEIIKIEETIKKNNLYYYFNIKFINSLEYLTQQSKTIFILYHSNILEEKNLTSYRKDFYIFATNYISMSNYYSKSINITRVYPLKFFKYFPTLQKIILIIELKPILFTFILIFIYIFVVVLIFLIQTNT